MVRFTSDHKVYIKILLWGMGGSGKVEFADILYRLTKEEKKDIEPTGNLTKIAMSSGSTLYFDRGIFQSTKQEKVFYHIYTVAGQSRFSPLRKKIFKGTDGVIFVVDAQPKFFKDNIESLQELNKITQGALIKEIPLVVIFNKKNSEDFITHEDFIQILKQEGLWFNESHELFRWNPPFYETNISYENGEVIYQCFIECAKKTGLYQIYGNGKAPITEELPQ